MLDYLCNLENIVHNEKQAEIDRYIYIQVHVKSGACVEERRKK
jgi:hypothetical protein